MINFIFYFLFHFLGSHVFIEHDFFTLKHDVYNNTVTTLANLSVESLVILTRSFTLKLTMVGGIGVTGLLYSLKWHSAVFFGD